MLYRSIIVFFQHVKNYIRMKCNLDPEPDIEQWGCCWCFLHTRERSLHPGWHSQLPRSAREKIDRVWWCKTWGSTFSFLTVWHGGKTEINKSQRFDITKLPQGEAAVVPMLEGRSGTDHCRGFILDDSETDIQNGTQTLNTNVMLDFWFMFFFFGFANL